MSRPKDYKHLVCLKGHYYSEVGRTSDGGCPICYKEYQQEYRRIHKEEIKKQRHEYQITHRKELNERKKKYRKEHPEVHRRSNRKRELEKLKTDPIFKIKVLLRNRIRDAIKNNRKGGSAVRDLGCSISFFKEYIESLFYGDMTWENWGPIWELDHIKALGLFDLTDRKQFLEACHYTNMQPLTVGEHTAKSARDRQEIAKMKRELKAKK